MRDLLSQTQNLQTMLQRRHAQLDRLSGSDERRILLEEQIRDMEAALKRRQAELNQLECRHASMRGCQGQQQLYKSSDALEDRPNKFMSCWRALVEVLIGRARAG